MHYIPSQQEKIHAHSFVLRRELRIQYTYTYVKNSEHLRFLIRYTYLALFAGICRVTDTNTHMRKKFLVNELEFKKKCIYVKKSPGIQNVFIPARMVCYIEVFLRI